MSIQVKDASGATQTVNTLPALGQATSANSLPFVLASDQPAVPVSSIPYSATPLGYQQITSLSASTALTVPGGAVFAMITVEGAGIRFRDDGVAPTTTVGMPLGAGQSQVFGGAAILAALRFIQQTAGAILNVSYYK